MLNAQEAAQITVDSQANIDQRAEIIWNNKIEEYIRQAAARGETHYQLVPEGSEDKYLKSLSKFAESLGYIVTVKEYSLIISWSYDVAKLKEFK